MESHPIALDSLSVDEDGSHSKNPLVETNHNVLVESKEELWSNFNLQVAGHPGCFVLSSLRPSILIKICSKHEMLFYEHLNTLASTNGNIYQFISCCMPKLFSSTLYSSSLIKNKHLDHVNIENLTNGLSSVSVIDLKLGSVLYDHNASTEKKLRMIKNASKSTSSTLSIRLCGFSKCYSISNENSNVRIVPTREFGRNISTKDDLVSIISLFFVNNAQCFESLSHNYINHDTSSGKEYIINSMDTVDNIISRIKLKSEDFLDKNKILKVLSILKNDILPSLTFAPVRLYATSLLIVSGFDLENRLNVRVKIIDYAHSYITVPYPDKDTHNNINPDIDKLYITNKIEHLGQNDPAGILIGLKNLISILNDLI